jgi:hypothetical protein
MRLGCSGCLTGVILVVFVGLVLAGTVGVVIKMASLPEEGRPAVTAGDGSRAQQKLVALARHGRRAQTVTLTEAEVNALLASHLVEAGGARIQGVQAHLIGDDRLELRARTPLGSALEEVGLGGLAGVLPAGLGARPVQLRVGGHLHVEDRGPRQLRLDLDEFEIGRQRLPTFALRLLVDPATLGALRWRLPEHVAQVAIEPGRVIIRTAP